MSAVPSKRAQSQEPGSDDAERPHKSIKTTSSQDQSSSSYTPPGNQLVFKTMTKDERERHRSKGRYVPSSSDHHNSDPASDDFQQLSQVASFARNSDFSKDDKDELEALMARDSDDRFMHLFREVISLRADKISLEDAVVGLLERVAALEANVEDK